MRIKNKLLLSLGASAAIITPIATVIACADTTTNNEKGIVKTIKASAVENQLNKIQLKFTGADGKGSFNTPV
jgi:hypothetical protein